MALSQEMITEFFPRQDALPALPPQVQTLQSLTSDREQAQVVAHVARGVYEHVTNKRRGHKVRMPEEMLHSFLHDIASERTPVVLGHGSDNPPGSLPLSHLLHRTFGGINADLSKLSSWQSFYNSTKLLFKPLWDMLTSRRKSHAFQAYLFEPPDATVPVSGEKERLKRKRRKDEERPNGGSANCIDFLSLAPVVHGAPLVVLPDGKVQAVDEWDRAHLMMHEQVLEAQRRDTSPPPSARVKPRVTKLTESESFQLSIRRTQKHSADDIMGLFDLCNLDATLTPTLYEPPFDRNDLFLTNVDKARQLFQQEREFTEAAVIRKAQSQPVLAPGVHYPALAMVFVQYVGPIGGDGTTYKCRYVTWCHKSLLVSANLVLHSCPFLEGVLAGEVRLNDGFTDLLDALTRLSCADSVMWKRRFSVHVIDDSCGLVSHDALPSFVALLDAYIEQYGGVSKSRDSDGIISLGFNLAQHHHARHRLIFESGSVETYRCIWQCNHYKALYEKAFDKATKAVNLMMDTAATFWLDLTKYVGDASLKSSAVASKVHPLAKFVLTTFAAVTTAMKELKYTYDKYCSVVLERKHKVDEAYAAARVQSFQDSAAVNKNVQQLHDDAQQCHTLHISNFRQLYCRQERLMQVKECVLEMWFFPCNPKLETWSEAERKIRVQDDSKAKYSVKVLRALVLLNLWELPTAERLDWWVELLPEAPPGKLDGSALAASFRANILTTHTDKNVQKVREGVVTAEKLNKESSKVLKARDLLQRHMMI